MNIDSALLKVINNFSFGKSKNKWEVIGKLTELYLKTGVELHLEALNEELKANGQEISSLTVSQKVEEKNRAEILELIRILANSTI